MALQGPFLAMPLGSGKLTSHDLPGHSEIHQGLGPYGPECSYATGLAFTRPSMSPANQCGAHAEFSKYYLSCLSTSLFRLGFSDPCDVV